jgi:hypothetical protein
MTIDKILDDLENEIIDNDFQKEWGNQFDDQDGAEEVWFHSGKNEDDFDGELPMEGPEWDEAVQTAIQNIFQEFVSNFSDKAKERNGGLYITRCISVDDANKFVDALKQGKAIEGYKGLGIYWSWDADKADCHWGNGKTKVYVYGLIDPRDIDYRQTALLNLDYATDFMEAEIRVKDGASIEVLSVDDADGNEIWEGEQTVKASLFKPRLNHTLIAALKQIIAEIYSSYNSWRMLTDQEIAQEYEWEYSKVEPVYGDIFPTAEDFKSAVKAGKAKKISQAQDRQIAYRSRSDSIEELKDLVESYRFPRDVDRIIDGFKTNAKIPYPIVLSDGGRLRIMAGNTRMDTAYLMGVTPKVLIVEVPEE